MTSLAAIYRSRRGDKNEQVENFLSATTGLIIERIPAAARTFLSLYRIELPADVRVTVEDQHPLYNHATGESAGIADLHLSWLDGGRRHQLVVEAKVDDDLTEEQLQRYQDALGKEAHVVALTATKKNSAIWASHITWQDWRAALEGVSDTLAQLLCEHLDSLGLGLQTSLDLTQVHRFTAQSQLLETISESLRPLVKKMYPQQTGRGVFPGRRSDDDWGGDDDVGAWCEWKRGRARSKDVSFLGAGLAIRLHREHLHVVASMQPLSARMRRELRDSKEAAWVPEAGSDWLEISLDTWPADAAPLAKRLQEALLRARHALAARHLDHPKDQKGLWQRVRGPGAVQLTGSWTCKDLAEAIQMTRQVRESAAAMERAWVNEARRQVQEVHGVECRPVFTHHSSFYFEDGSAQAGVELRLHKPSKVARAWCWFRSQGATEQCAAALEGRGWRVKWKPMSRRWWRLRAWPPQAETIRVLTEQDMLRLGTELGDALVGVVPVEPTAPQP
jgi:hypothetical protein